MTVTTLGARASRSRVATTSVAIYTLAPALCLFAPFVNFLCVNDYPLSRLEVLLIFTGCFAVGPVSGTLRALGFATFALIPICAATVLPVAFLANTGLGIYQAGAEWKFWEPPASCAAPSTLPSFDLKEGSFDRIPASCGVASWRFLGLSFAGWNVVASTLLAAGAAMAAVTAMRPRSSP